MVHCTSSLVCGCACPCVCVSLNANYPYSNNSLIKVEIIWMLIKFCFTLPYYVFMIQSSKSVSLFLCKHWPPFDHPFISFHPISWSSLLFPNTSSPSSFSLSCLSWVWLFSTLELSGSPKFLCLAPPVCVHVLSYLSGVGKQIGLFSLFCSAPREVFQATVRTSLCHSSAPQHDSLIRCLCVQTTTSTSGPLVSL